MSWWAHTGFPERFAAANDETPPPAPFALHVAVGLQGPVAWCICERDSRLVLAHGTAPDLACAQDEGRAAAERLGLVPVADGWLSSPSCGMERRA